MVSRGDMMSKEDILEILAIPLIGLVPDHEDIITSTNRGMPVAFDDHSPIGAAYRRIASRIQGETIPIPEFVSDTSFWGTLKRWIGLSAAQEVA